MLAQIESASKLGMTFGSSEYSLYVITPVSSKTNAERLDTPLKPNRFRFISPLKENFSGIICLPNSAWTLLTCILQRKLHQKCRARLIKGELFRLC